MHLVYQCKKMCQKLRIRGSGNLLKSVIYPSSILALQQHKARYIEFWHEIFLEIFASVHVYRQI